MDFEDCWLLTWLKSRQELKIQTLTFWDIPAMGELCDLLFAVHCIYTGEIHMLENKKSLSKFVLLQQVCITEQVLICYCANV